MGPHLRIRSAFVSLTARSDRVAQRRNLTQNETVTDIIDPTKDADLSADLNAPTAVPSVETVPGVRLPILSGAFSRFRRILRLAQTRIEQTGRTLSRSSRHSALRRIPLGVALTTAVLTAPVLWILTHRLADSRQAANWNYVVQTAQRRTLLAQEMLAGGAKFEDPLVFLVKPQDKYTESLGVTDLEPPLFKLAKEAEGGEAQNWFQQNEQAWQTFTRRYNADTYIVTLENVTWLQASNDEMRILAPHQFTHGICRSSCASSR
jgi:hypothetical protein